MDFASAVLSFLAGATVRSLALTVPVAALLAVARVRSAASRHAVLFVTVAGMLALAILNPLLPAIPLRILRAPAAAALPAVAVPVPAMDAAAAPAPVPAPAGGGISLAALVDAVYFAGLAFCLVRLLFGALFTRRLLRGASPVEGDFACETYESSWISVPLTVGWLRPRILLPAGWRDWAPAKLQAVLAHEQNHIRRADWAIALVAALNRSLYWFNPLAWWLERRLATLAEQACDDAALLALGRRESYAQALLEMAAAVKNGQGRLVWEAMAMAKGAEVRMRIERILDDNRPIPRGLTRARWIGLVACALPLIYLAATLQPAPAQSRERDQLPPAIAQALEGRAPLTPSGAAQLEQYLSASPDDLQARQQVILYYFANGISQPRLNHIDWLIANHPDSHEAALTSLGITPSATSFNSVADYEQAANLWRQAAAAHPLDEHVLVNAGRFFSQPGSDPNEAERLLLQARHQAGNSMLAASTLAQLYAGAILGTSGDPKFANDNPNFGNRVRAEIEDGKDAQVLVMTGVHLTGVAETPKPGRKLRPGTLDLSEHPLLVPITELGARLTALGQKMLGLGGGPVTVMTGQVKIPHEVIMTTTPGSQESSSPRTVLNADQQAQLPTAPMPVTRVQPAYPPLAMQARIQGVVSLAVQIGPDGHPTNIQVLRGHPLLIQAALEAVKNWVYPPAAGTFEQQVTFSLPQADAAAVQQATQERAAQLKLLNAQLQAGGAMPTPPGAPAAGESKPPTPQRIKIGPVVQASMLVKQVAPEYPAAAKSAGIQGTVTLAIVIAKDGTVVSTTPVDGPPALIPAAQAAVMQWAYKPTLLNGDPVEVGTTVSVPFELNQ